MVDDDGIAGEGEVPGEGHRAVCGSAGRVAGDGVELGGVRLGTLLAVRDLDLAEIEQNEVIFRRADEAAGPELFLRGLLVEGPDAVPELGVGRLGGGGFGFHFRRAEVLGQNGQGLGEGLAVDGEGDVMGPGGGVVGRGDVGPPAGGAAGALDTAEVGLHRGGCFAHHAGDGHAHDAALLHPLGGKLHIGAGLEGEPEGEAVPAGGLGGVLQTGIFPDGPIAAALKAGDDAARREPPDGHLGLVLAVGGEEEAVVFGGGAGEKGGSVGGLDGQGGIGGPVGRGEGPASARTGAPVLRRPCPARRPPAAPASRSRSLPAPVRRTAPPLPAGNPRR